LIQVLPDHIANQIAAGEVIQRPASAVKELLENAVDAGATVIDLIIHDAGKSLVQVIDNGKGMDKQDAQLCFARHATSKINAIEDLFQIRTMGFRGEALASIAAVSQVELKTKRAQDTIGHSIELEHSEIVREQPVAMPTGTSLAMKNLFFNIPARRNFLKSNAAEMRHIIEEFTRVALAFPSIVFTLQANNQQLFHVESGSLKQRIVQLLGSQYAAKLVAVQEDTDYLTIRGFVGKPDTARKTRGEQYFFVNNRFIKSAYLHHAVMQAFQSLLPADHFPLYVLFIDLDPKQLDINVHPTKQEIKFEDEKIVYAFVQAAIRHALAQFSVTPTLDFELDASIQGLSAVQQPSTDASRAATRESALFQHFTQKNKAHSIEPGTTASAQHWKPFTPAAALPTAQEFVPSSFPAAKNILSELTSDSPVTQVANTYLLVPTTGGFSLIHQQAAHERVLYEQFVQATQEKPVATQRSLFPITLQVSATDALLLDEMQLLLQQVGFHLEKENTTTYILQGVPAGFEHGNNKAFIESLVDEYKHFNPEIQASMQEKLFRTLAKKRAVKAGTPLTEKERQQLVQDLLACKHPSLTPFGQPTLHTFTKEELDRLFQR
jgi:DNA mismatch repair protein MutL